MAIHYRTQGFVLKKTEKGEADMIFTVYTQEFGKLEILGKAIRKIKSKLRPGMELFYLTEIEFIQGKNYKTLTDAIVIEKFRNLRGDLKKIEITNRIVNSLDSLSKEQEKDKKIWDLLKESFSKLNNLHLSISDLELIYYYFLWNLLSILGYQIDLYRCVLCQKKLAPSKIYLNLEEGGIVDEDCFQKLKGGREISPDVVKIIRIFLNREWQTLSKLKISDPHKKLLKLASEEYFSYVKG